jgi:hypothetical protein
MGNLEARTPCVSIYCQEQMFCLLQFKLEVPKCNTIFNEASVFKKISYFNPNCYNEGVQSYISFMKLSIIPLGTADEIS